MNRIISFVVAMLLSCTLFGQNATTNQQYQNDDALLSQYIKTQGTNTILFDRSNIKMFWIDASVLSSSDSFDIHLSENNDQTYESIPLRIQLANVDESQDCKITVIAKEEDYSFSVLNMDSKTISESKHEEDFIRYKIESATFHLDDTRQLSFHLRFHSTRKVLSIKAIILSFSKNENSRLLVHIQKWKNDIPDSRKDNLCKNGDFETILSEEKQLEHMEALSKHGFVPKPGISYPFPDVWWQSIDDWKKGIAPVIKIVTENALSGKYSLLIDSEQSSYVGTINSLSFGMKKEYEVELFVKNIGTKEAKLSFYVCSWNTNPYTFSQYQVFQLQPGETYKIHIPVSKRNFPDLPSFYFSIRVQGKVLLDNVTVFSKE